MNEWVLTCPWCEFYIIVGNRGMTKTDMGAGVEAANMMERHIIHKHERTWLDFLYETKSGAETNV